MSSPTLSRQRPSTRQPQPAGDGTPPFLGDEPRTHGRLTGRYRYDRRNGAWWWSPEMFALYGLRPGTAEPCTEVLLHNQHPEDRERVLAALTGACTAGRPFSLESRLVRADDGEQRTVVLLGEPEVDPAGGVSAVAGVCIDVTPSVAGSAESDRVRALEAEVEQLKAAMASRATIEQAKGILMLLTSCGEQVAFDLLAHISSHTHRKVRDVAHSITESARGTAKLPDDVCAIIRDACPPAPAAR